MTQTARTEITANAIYKVTVKDTNQQCYAVPSDSQPGHFYITCFDEDSSGWTCTCRHGEEMAKVGKDAHCKHSRAAQVSILANKPAKREVPISERGSLNGNRGFSLLK